MSRSTPERRLLRTVRRWFVSPRPHRVFLQEGRLWHRAPGVSEAVQHEGWAGWCAAHAGAPVQVILGGSLTCDVVAPADLPLERPAAAQAWARQQWLHYHGSGAQDWPVAAWPRGASGLAGMSLASLLEPAQAHRVSLLQARPWWSCAWPAVQRVAPQALPDASGVLWLVEERTVTRLQLRRGALQALERRWLDEPLPEALDDLIAEYPDGAGPQCVVGHGLEVHPRAQAEDDAAALRSLRRASVLGRLNGPVPQARWWGR